MQRRHDLYRIAANDTGGADEREGRKGKMETDTCDAIGRAYCAGLLGHDDRAKDMLTTARRLFQQYWRILGEFSGGDSLLKLHPEREPSVPISAEDKVARDRLSEQSLNASLDKLNQLNRTKGDGYRRAFDQLVIDPNPDHGPPWLDAIVWAHRHKRRASDREYAMLAKALEGLDAIA